jgi:hypothetical protein
LIINNIYWTDHNYQFSFLKNPINKIIDWTNHNNFFFILFLLNSFIVYVKIEYFFLIQAKYKEAYECLKRQIHPSDGRFPLYKVHEFHIIKTNSRARGWGINIVGTKINSCSVCLGVKCFFFFCFLFFC